MSIEFLSIFTIGSLDYYFFLNIFIPAGVGKDPAQQSESDQLMQEWKVRFELLSPVMTTWRVMA